MFVLVDGRYMLVMHKKRGMEGSISFTRDSHKFRLRDLEGLKVTSHF
jgi:hypothetical protein